MFQRNLLEKDIELTFDLQAWREEVPIPVEDAIEGFGVEGGTEGLVGDDAAIVEAVGVRVLVLGHL